HCCCSNYSWWTPAVQRPRTRTGPAISGGFAAGAKGAPLMPKRLAVLLSLTILPTLGLWLRAADPVADPARAAFEKGNALLRDAQQACAYHEPDLLQRAAGQYRECLEAPAGSLEAGPLYTAARHNLELTKLLLAQAAPPEKA